MKYYDFNQDGGVSYEEFVTGLREPLSERRQKMLQKVYRSLDPENRGFVTTEVVIGVYDVSLEPSFIAGKKSKHALVEEFLSNFETDNGFISKRDFFEYYEDISISLGSEEAFVKMLESTWQCPENDLQDDPMARPSMQLLISEVRKRILDLVKGDPSQLRKVHAEFDINGSGNLTIDEWSNMIAKLKIAVDRKYVYPFFKFVD